MTQREMVQASLEAEHDHGCYPRRRTASEVILARAQAEIDSDARLAWRQQRADVRADTEER